MFAERTFVMLCGISQRIRRNRSYCSRKDAAGVISRRRSLLHLHAHTFGLLVPISIEAAVLGYANIGAHGITARVTLEKARDTRLLPHRAHFAGGENVEVIRLVATLQREIVFSALRRLIVKLHVHERVV